MRRITYSVLSVKVLVAQVKTTIAAISEYDRHLEALCLTHQDYELFASLPGAGPVHAARLTAALGSDRSRWPSADELVRFSGIAPIIERSGKQFRIRWRYFCPKFFRQTFHEFGFVGCRIEEGNLIAAQGQRSTQKSLADFFCIHSIINNLQVNYQILD